MKNSEIFTQTRTNQSYYSLRSFPEFQHQRMEKFNMAMDDLSSKQEHEILVLQSYLDDLLVKLGNVQSEMSSDQRKFQIRKESLITEIKKVRTDLDSTLSQERMYYLNEMERIQKQHNIEFDRIALTINLKNQEKNNTNKTDPFLNETRIRAKKVKANVEKYHNGDEEEEDNYSQGIEERIEELEIQRKELKLRVQEEHKLYQSQLKELTMIIYEQDVNFNAEIEELQQKMNKDEESYQQKIEKLAIELQKIRENKKNNTIKRNQKIENFQKQIENMESNIRQKFQNATRIADKLKTALNNANLRKSKQMENEKKQIEEQQKIMSESIELQKKSFSLQRELEKTQKDTFKLKKQQSMINSRYTAHSIFLDSF